MMINNPLGFLFSEPYEERKIDRWKSEDGRCVVDTARVNDARKPYETAISHKAYNGGGWIIVQEYDTAKQAREGHEFWAQAAAADRLPDPLVDVSTSGIGSMLRAVGGQMSYAREAGK